MPIMRATKGGKPGYKYGEHGAVYTYNPHSKASRMRAKKKAIKQAVAIQHSQKMAGKPTEAI